MKGSAAHGMQHAIAGGGGVTLLYPPQAPSSTHTLAPSSPLQQNNVGSQFNQ